MYKKLIISVAVLATTPLAIAGGHEKPHAEGWTNFALENQLRQMPKGNAINGQKIHQNMMCNACHGEEGESPTRNYASLNGQTVDYTMKTMLDYQDARRSENYGQANIMVKIAQSMTAQDIADVAVFYAQASTTQWKVESLAVDDYKRIDRLVRKGDASRMITPCASCHGTHGEGKDITPAIAGQVPEYFVRTMTAYKNHQRQNDVNEGMSQFTHDLSEKEIEQLATYYANQGAQK